jgi:hypothetical protein
MRRLIPVLALVLLLAPSLTTPLVLAVDQVALSYVSGSNTTKCGGSACAGGAEYTFATSAGGAQQVVTCTGTFAAFCAGDDAASSPSVGVGMLLISGFTAASIPSGANYEVDMVIGTLEFAFVLHGTGTDVILYTYYYTTGGGATTWNPGPTTSCGGTCSGAGGTNYPTSGFASSDVGFTLYDSGTGNGANKFDGGVFLYVTKAYLISLGGTGSGVNTVYASTYSGATVCPGSVALSGSFCPISGGTLSGTNQDRAPSTGNVSFTLAQPLPELPFGLLFLAAPAVLAYALIRKKRVRVP